MKVLVLQGIPASGKSTKAKELVAKGHNWFRVNKDDLRSMFDGDSPYNYKRERQVISAEKALVRSLLSNESNVVVDDTNLTSRHIARWETIAGEFGAKFEIHRMATPLLTCIERNMNRSSEHYVPVSVLKNMARGIGMPDAFHDREVICDIDGTVADVAHRLKYMTGPEKNWDKAFSLIHLDSVRWDVVEQVRADHEDGATIIFVSARQESQREVTEEWLKQLNLPYFTLIMRNNGDFRDDVLVKKNILTNFFIRDRIQKVYDDRLRVIKMWVEEGIPVVDVNVGGEY